MSVTIEQFNALKRDVETADREHARAEGALGSLMSRLGTEFGCSSLEEAERLLPLNEKEAKEAEEKFEKALKEFKEEWLDE